MKLERILSRKIVGWHYKEIKIFQIDQGTTKITSIEDRRKWRVTPIGDGLKKNLLSELHAINE